MANGFIYRHGASTGSYAGTPEPPGHRCAAVPSLPTLADVQLGRRLLPRGYIADLATAAQHQAQCDA